MDRVSNDDADEALITAPQSTHVLSLRRGHIEVVGRKASVPIDMEPLQIGRSQRCALVLDDPTVSKVHAEIQATPRGVRVVDLNSRNGTFIGNASIVDAYMTDACEFRCGDKRLRFVPEPVHERVITAPERFGGLIGTTPEMVALFAKLQRYAPTTMSILIQGETGTGKERVAQAVHRGEPKAQRRTSSRSTARQSLTTCSRTRLFGHVRGAFTGADRARARAVRRSRWRHVAVRKSAR